MPRYPAFSILMGKKYQIHEQKIESIKQKIVLVMGQECKVEFIFVDDIPPSASGKYRYTVLKIKRRH